MLGNRCNRLDDSQSATICPILAAKASRNPGVGGAAPERQRTLMAQNTSVKI